MTPDAPTRVLPKDETTLRFGRFALDLRSGILGADGREIALRPKTFALLHCLASRPGELVSKAELMDAVWPGVIVGDDSLTQCVGELRAALGEPGLVKTVPRRGYRLELPPANVPAAEASASALATVSDPKRRPPRRFIAGSAVAVAIAVFGALIWWRVTAVPVRLDAAFAAQRAIVILPFKDVGDAPSSAYSRAVTEDVAIAVARLPDVLVYSTGSTAAPVSGQGNALAAASSLGASHVLTGSVERRGDTTLIRAELHRIKDGTLLWNERFEYPGSAPWTWQRDATQRIAQSLDVRMRDIPAMAAGTRPSDPVAAVQQAMNLVINARSRNDVLRARSLLDSALAADPNSAVALTFWAFTHTQQVMRGWSDDQEGDTAAAEAAVDRVLAQRPDYWPAHFHRGFVMYLRGDADAAARECETVLALWPNEPHALQLLGFYHLLQGRVEDVAAPVRLSLQLNPLEPSQVATAHLFLGMAFFHQQRDEEAYDELRQAAAANPALGRPQLWMASLDALYGRDEQARANLQAYLKARPDTRIDELIARDATMSPDYVARQQRLYDGLRKAGMS